ncbi:MAG: hypothetical protein ACI4AQ_01590 [Lachnospiraceae bacterium]
MNTKRAVLSASMTLEAMFVLPLFLFFSVIFIYVMNLMNFQNRVNESMYDTLRTLSKMEYTKEGSSNAAAALAGFYTQLNGKNVDRMRIVGGVAGMLPYQSDFEEDLMTFQLSYQAVPPFDLAGIMRLNCTQRGVVRKWIGNDDLGDLKEGTGNNKDTLVYITENGTVYHLDRGCSHLQLSIKTVERSRVGNYRNTDGGKYYPCEKCGKKSSVKQVYITDSGDRYHTNINCSGLKRGIMIVPQSSVTGWPICSRCGKR